MPSPAIRTTPLLSMPSLWKSLTSVLMNISRSSSRDGNLFMRRFMSRSNSGRRTVSLNGVVIPPGRIDGRPVEYGLVLDRLALLCGQPGDIVMGVIAELVGVHVGKPVQDIIDDFYLVAFQEAHVRLSQRKVLPLRILKVLIINSDDFIFGHHLVHDFLEFKGRGPILVFHVCRP